MGNTVVTKERIEAVLSWFNGKSKVAAAAALEILAASELAEEWVGPSRSVVASLTKANVAANLAKKFGAELESVGGYNLPNTERGWEISHSLRFQSFHTDINFEAIRQNAPEHLVSVIDSAKIYFEAFRPLFILMNKLDVTRPRPVVTKIGASPTVNKTINQLGISDAESSFQVEVCPTEWFLKEINTQKGKVFVKVGKLVWPEGTRHNVSRFSDSNHCQACGHAIKNSGNFIPLVLSTATVVPHSLWVGRDCAKTIFGLDIKGEMAVE